MNENKLKTKLGRGEAAIGSFVRMGAISVEILGKTGWDYVIIDAEHGVHTMEDISNMIRAAKAAGITCIVRVPGVAAINVMRCLDAGADGVQIPQIVSLEQLREAVEAARYYPKGRRGACAYSAATGYSTIPFSEHLATSNEEVMVIVHVENVTAAERIGEMLAVGGIDVVFCGPWDLSQSLGIPGETSNPKILDIVDRVFAACDEKGVATGIFVQNPNETQKWLEKGVKYLACSVDVGMYADAAFQNASDMRKQIEAYAGDPRRAALS
jgi:4-hydroxy-2-oxoheptanedioate aldolase